MHINTAIFARPDLIRQAQRVSAILALAVGLSVAACTQAFAAESKETRVPTTSAASSSTRRLLIALHGAEDPGAKQILNDALALMQSHQARAAASRLQQGLNQFPRCASIHFELGNALSDCHEFDNAINEYQTALNMDPPFPEAILNIAYAYCNSGRNAQAQPWFQRFIKENPNSSRTQEVEAQMLMSEASDLTTNHRYDAKKLLEQAIAVNPQDLHAHFKLARVRDELGDTRGAISEYEQVLAIQPKYTAAMFNIAGCYQSLGQPANAIEWFTKYLNVNPNAKDAETVHNMIAKLREKEGEFTSDPQQVDYMSAVMQDGKCFRWPRERMPLRVFVANGANTPGFRDSFAKALFDSFSSWSQASQNRIVFKFVTNSNDADITVSWTGNPYEVRDPGTDVEQGICLLHYLPDKRGDQTIHVQHADVRILLLDRESLKPLSDDDMKKTCLHELGHALGLHGHSSNNHDIMFFSVSPTVWPVLSKRDKATLIRIYEDYPALMASF